jgi:GNAT superfamily N-acetyltransferase
MPHYRIDSFLPGTLVLTLGRSADYAHLQRFHYRGGRPATIAQVWVARYAPPQRPAEVVGAAIVSYPTLALHVRQELLGIGELSPPARHRFINRHIRTISRVVVHPTFRAMGLAGALVRAALLHCPTRYVEALAIMGRAHPFFELAGMRPHRPPDPARPVYYLFDRDTDPPPAPPGKRNQPRMNTDPHG